MNDEREPITSAGDPSHTPDNRRLHDMGGDQGGTGEMDRGGGGLGPQETRKAAATGDTGDTGETDADDAIGD